MEQLSDKALWWLHHNSNVKESMEWDGERMWKHCTAWAFTDTPSSTTEPCAPDTALQSPLKTVGLKALERDFKFL